MDYEETKRLLAENDIDLDCFSPLEISCKDGSKATGWMAEIVIRAFQYGLKDEDDE